jgi:hypothetical protein
MSNNDQLANQISEILDVSVNQAKKWINLMTAEQLINMTSAADAEDADSMQSVIDEVHEEQHVPDMTLTEIRKEINKLGKQNLKNNETHDDVWPLIAGLSKSEWKMIWPAVDKPVLQSLLSEVLDEPQDDVSSEDADSILSYAKDQLQEHMIYEGQVVQVVIPQGPHRTVGIRTPTGVRMVHRRHLHQLHEHVMGMTAMPSLARIQALAGVDPPSSPSHTVQVNVTAASTNSRITKLYAQLCVKQSELQDLMCDTALDTTQIALVCKHMQHLLQCICDCLDA